MLLAGALLCSCADEKPHFLPAPGGTVEIGGIGATPSSDAAALLDDDLTTYFEAEVGSENSVEAVVDWQRRADRGLHARIVGRGGAGRQRRRSAVRPRVMEGLRVGRRRVVERGGQPFGGRVHRPFPETYLLPGGAGRLCQIQIRVQGQRRRQADSFGHPFPHGRPVCRMEEL